MTLAAGTRLGPYEIVAPLGAGGMGEVYKARDTRLDRTVAIKVLPAPLASDRQFRERFDREARTISQLDHPHICTLHDVGHQDGLDFLVMQYLDGETLADPLTKGPLPLALGLRYAVEIAAGLDHAHRAGIVHRDLKPGNVMLTKSGAKLLDFGLAKTGVPAIALAGTAAPTAAPTLTAQGTILGTLQYMTPEQLEGHDTDARTDIFAFGAVLYEVFTGRRAFEGESHMSLAAAILEHEPPPLSIVQPLLPPSLDRVIGKCLAKDPDRRWQTARDLHDELQWLAEAPAQTASVAGPGDDSPVAARGPSRMRRERALWAAASGLLAAATVALAYTVASRPEAQGPPRQVFEISTPAAPDTFNVQFALSPSGGHLVGVSARGEASQGLWIRAIDAGTTRELPDTLGAAWPFWSPDGRFLGYFADGQLKTVDVTGAAAVVLAAAPFAGGGTWNRENVILFAPTFSGSLYRVNVSGGTATPVTELDRSRSETAHLRPHFLPDGIHFLYLAVSNRPQASGIYVGSLESRTRTRLVASTAEARFAPPDQLLFMRNDTLMAQRFDPTTLVLSGDPVPVAESVGIDRLNGAVAAFTVSDNGMLVYRTGVGTTARQFFWTDRSGRVEEAIAEPGAYENPRLARDGVRLAFFKMDDTAGDIWISDLARKNTTRLTFDPAVDNYPVWSPDDTRIVFASNRSGVFDLYQKSASGTGEDELLLETPHDKIPLDWSADGRYVLYQETNPETAEDLWALPLSRDTPGEGLKPVPIVATRFSESWGAFSPDGRWVAYSSLETGQAEIYVQTLPPSGRKWQLSTRTGWFPAWRSDGREIFYDQAGQLMAVEVTTTPGDLKAGIPRSLFRGLNFMPRNNYDVVSDGRRFLVLSSAAQLRGQQSPPLTVVLNWTALLPR